MYNSPWMPPSLPTIPPSWRPPRRARVVPIGLGVLLVLQACAGSTPAPPPKPAVTAPSKAPVGASTEGGREVFASKGCGACHTLAAVPGATGTVGPELNTIATRAVTREPDTGAEAYIRESIRNPGAFVVPGFPPAMPQVPLSEDELAALVALLLEQQ